MVALVDPQHNVLQEGKLAARLEPFIRMGQGGMSADEDAVAERCMAAPEEGDQIRHGISCLFVAEVVLDDPIDQLPSDP